MKFKRALAFLMTFMLTINVSANGMAATVGDGSSENRDKPCEPKQKIIYLTFDDGPTKKNTPKILETLEKEQVPATFFLIGENVDLYKDVAKQLKEHGMAIGAHSYSHVTSKIYKSGYNYKEDLEKCIETIRNVIGEEPINVTRMPCGSTNTIANANVKKEIKRHIKLMGLNYVDWNVSGEDAIYKNVPSNVIWKNIMKDSKNKDTIVLLLHDGYYNSNTAELLPKIIQHFKKEGYTFKSLKDLPDEEVKDLEKLRVMNRK